MISEGGKAVKEFIRSREWWNRPLEETRCLMEQMGNSVPLPDGIRHEAVDVGGVKGDLLIPPDASAEAAVLYLHGGGYCLGITGINRAFVAQIALDCKVKVLMADYRLAPENPYPAAIEDSLACYRWLLESACSPDRIVVMGDSSGCGLSLVMLNALKDAGEPMPAAAAFICPTLDHSHSGESRISRAEADPYQCKPEFFMDRHYVGERNPRNPGISPLFGNLAELPPMLIHGAGDDIFLSDSTMLAQRVSEKGGLAELKVWDDMWHIFHMHREHVPEAREAMAEMVAFIKEKMAASPGKSNLDLT